MTTNHHTQYPTPFALNASEFNSRAAALDEAITNAIGADSTAPLFNVGASSELTIASGAITATQTYHTVDTEGDASTDDLETITLATGRLAIIFPENGARTVVVKHNSGGGNIRTFTGSDITLDETYKGVLCISDGTNVFAFAYGGGSASGGSPDYGAGASKVLASDIVAVGSDRNIIVQAESGTADDLIEVTGLSVGEVVLLRADSGDTITVKHNDAGATIKILLYGDADIVLDEDNPLVLRYVDTNVLAQDVDQTAAGGSGAPTTAQYLTLAGDAGLSAERVFTLGAGVAGNDGGANGNYTLSANMGAGASKVLASGVVAVGSDRNIIVQAESGTADDLIEVTGLSVGERVLLRADSGDTITVKHNDAGATIKILLYGDADIVLDEDNPLILEYVDTNVLAQPIDQNSGGGGGGGLYESIAILADEKTSDSFGGSAAANTWNARDLNTEISDTDSIVTITSNQFTPIAGDYIIVSSAPAYRVNQHRIRLFNVTSSSVVAVGTSERSNNTDSTQTRSFLVTYFTANGTDAYRIDHRPTVVAASFDLGFPSRTGDAEQYLLITLYKLA